MEEGKKLELNLDQMEQITGGKDANTKRTYKCRTCGETFDTFLAYHNHCLNVHPNDLPDGGNYA